MCGTAAQSQITQLVQDVDKFPGHIACDGDSKSEIVVPILVPKAVQDADDGELEDAPQQMETVAIIDIDCAVWKGFDEVDKLYLEKLASLIAKSCDW